MKVACIQPKLLVTKEKCYEEVDRLINTLSNENDGCDLLCLPERWVPFHNNFEENFQEERGSSYNFIKNEAKEYGINIISGAIWEKRPNEKKPFIASYYFNSQGEEIGRQDKLHLYSYERKYFKPGKILKIFNLQDFSFSILICFDMAFFETPRLAVENGVDLLVSPTQIRKEGLYNWNIYLQARALENRVPVVACNTLGTINFSTPREFLGKSKIISYQKGAISPSILIVKEGPMDSGYVYDDIDLKFPRKLRKIRMNEKIDKASIDIQNIN